VNTELEYARTALYRFYDDADRLLYVGITHDIEQRWASHARNQPWWLDVARKTVDWHPNRPVAERLEDEALRRDRPLYDRSGRLRGEVEQGELVNARLALETERALTVIAGAIGDGTFPAWQLMPTIGGLSERFQLPLVAVTKAVDALERQGGRIVRFGDRFSPADPSEAPSEAAREHGGVYFLAGRIFRDKPFSLPQLVAATGYSSSTAQHHQRKLAKSKQVEHVSMSPDGERLFRVAGGRRG